MASPYDAVNDLLGLREQFVGGLPPVEQPKDFFSSLMPKMGPNTPMSAMAPYAPSKTSFNGDLSRYGARIHSGFQGMQPNAQQGVLSLLDAFPGLRQSSGYRDPEHNARVNGVKNSRHLLGLAGDFSGSAQDMATAAAWATQNGYKPLIHNAGSGMHLHVSFG